MSDNKKNNLIDNNKYFYFDNMATTACDPLVIAEMNKYWGEAGCYANASSAHPLGRQAGLVVDKAALTFAKCIGADAAEIIWTSGATEANNLAIRGATAAYPHKGRHIITVATEHKAVLEVVQQMRDQDYTVDVLPVNDDGLLDLELLEKTINQETVLVSVMLVNNEIGVIQDIKKIAKIVKASGAIFHVDAAQALGKVAIVVKDLGCDLMSFSAHKFHGPKGVGALYVRREPKIRLCPQITGGAQQRKMRGGTLPVALIHAMAVAAQLVCDNFEEENKRLWKLHKLFLNNIKSIVSVTLNGSSESRVPHNLNIFFHDIHGDALFYELSRYMAVAKGSACNAATALPSHVLQALGGDSRRSTNSIRFSIGRYTTEEDVLAVVELMKLSLQRLQRIMPAGDYNNE